MQAPVAVEIISNEIVRMMQNWLVWVHGSGCIEQIKTAVAYELYRTGRTGGACARTGGSQNVAG
jgi:hypothetical protein